MPLRMLLTKRWSGKEIYAGMDLTKPRTPRLGRYGFRGLDQLPMELILNICDQLRKKHIRRLNLTCRRLYRMTLASLYHGETASPSAESVFGWACNKGISGTVELLIEFGFSIHQPKQSSEHVFEGPTPLEAAVRLSRVEIVELLMYHGADVNSTIGCTTPLIESLSYPYLVESGSGFQLWTTQLLLICGADPDQSVAGVWLATPLVAAISGRKIELIKLLLAYGAEVNPWEDRPLYRAICYHEGSARDVEIIQTLLERGANPNAKGRMETCGKHPIPLARAVYECSIWPTPVLEGEAGTSPLDIVDLLLAYGADINYIPVMDRESIIHRAIHPRQKLVVLRYLLERGADPNSTNLSLAKRYGMWTPLHKAMWKKIPADRVALLLQYGASSLLQQPDTHFGGSPNPPGNGRNTTRKHVTHPLAISPRRPEPTAHMMYYPLNTHHHATPLEQLLANHLSPITGLATGGWCIPRDWAKFRLLMEFSASPSEILSPLTKCQLAKLFSLTVAACRYEVQLCRHLVNFGRVTWLKLEDLLSLSCEDGFTAIWTVHDSDGAAGNQGGANERRLEELRDRRRDEMFYVRGLSRATRAREVLKDMSIFSKLRQTISSGFKYGGGGGKIDIGVAF